MRIVVLLTMAVLLAGTGLHAQHTGQGAGAGTASGDSFGWALGIGGLAVIGTVVGLTAAAASASTPTFSH